MSRCRAARAILTIGAGCVLLVGSCQNRPSVSDSRALTYGLVRLAVDSFDRLSESDSAECSLDMESAAKRANGSNEALLAFLNDRGLLISTTLTKNGHVGLTPGTGRLGFCDDWGRPLYVIPPGVSRIIAFDGREVVRPQSTPLSRLIIWSVGENGIDEAGSGDDLKSW